MKLARYQSHKIVEAGKIVGIAPGAETLSIEQADGSVIEFGVDPKLLARGQASCGDYLVRYEDGYVSWSPAKAFEEGYSRISAHASDCAIHNGPALTPGPCDCGAA